MKSILKHGVQIYEILLKSVQVHEVRSRKIGSTRAAHVRKTRAAVPGICLLRHYVQRARQTNSPPEFCTTWLLHTFATFAHDLSTKISGCILPWPAVSLHGFQHFRKSTQGTDTATKIHVQSSPTDEALEYPTLELFIVDIMRNTHYHSYIYMFIIVDTVDNGAAEIRWNALLQQEDGEMEKRRFQRSDLKELRSKVSHATQAMWSRPQHID